MTDTERPTPTPAAVAARAPGGRGVRISDPPRAASRAGGPVHTDDGFPDFPPTCGAASGLCVLCGDRPATGGRPWCSRRCRTLLRDEARVRAPGVPDAEAWRIGLAWAAAERARVGSRGPLTDRAGVALAAASEPRPTLVAKDPRARAAQAIEVRSARTTGDGPGAPAGHRGDRDDPPPVRTPTPPALPIVGAPAHPKES